MVKGPEGSRDLEITPDVTQSGFKAVDLPTETPDVELQIIEQNTNAVVNIASTLMNTHEDEKNINRQLEQIKAITDIELAEQVKLGELDIEAMTGELTYQTEKDKRSFELQQEHANLLEEAGRVGEPDITKKYGVDYINSAKERIANDDTLNDYQRQRMLADLDTTFSGLYDQSFKTELVVNNAKLKGAWQVAVDQGANAVATGATTVDNLMASLEGRVKEIATVKGAPSTPELQQGINNAFSTAVFSDILRLVNAGKFAEAEVKLNTYASGKGGYTVEATGSKYTLDNDVYKRALNLIDSGKASVKTPDISDFIDSAKTGFINPAAQSVEQLNATTEALVRQAEQIYGVDPAKLANVKKDLYELREVAVAQNTLTKIAGMNETSLNDVEKVLNSVQGFYSGNVTIPIGNGETMSLSPDQVRVWQEQIKPVKEMLTKMDNKADVASLTQPTIGRLTAQAATVLGGTDMYDANKSAASAQALATTFSFLKADADKRGVAANYFDSNMLNAIKENLELLSQDTSKDGTGKLMKYISTLTAATNAAGVTSGALGDLMKAGAPLAAIGSMMFNGDQTYLRMFVEMDKVKRLNPTVKDLNALYGTNPDDTKTFKQKAFKTDGTGNNTYDALMQSRNLTANQKLAMKNIVYELSMFTGKQPAEFQKEIGNKYWNKKGLLVPKTAVNSEETIDNMVKVNSNIINLAQVPGTALHNNLNYKGYNTKQGMGMEYKDGGFYLYGINKKTGDKTTITMSNGRPIGFSTAELKAKPAGVAEEVWVNQILQAKLLAQVEIANQIQSVKNKGMKSVEQKKLFSELSYKADILSSVDFVKTSLKDVLLAGGKENNYTTLFTNKTNVLGLTNTSIRTLTEIGGTTKINKYGDVGVDLATSRAMKIIDTAVKSYERKKPPQHRVSQVNVAPKNYVYNSFTNLGQAGQRNSVTKLITHYSKISGVENEFILAVAQKESGMSQYDKKGRVISSPAGALGVMQLMPGTAKNLGADPTNPEQNIQAGIRYLKSKLNTFNQNKYQALAAYNAGDGAVKAYIEGKSLPINGKVLNPTKISYTELNKMSDTQLRRYVESGEFNKRLGTRFSPEDQMFIIRNGIPPFNDTVAYVKDIMRDYSSKKGFAW